jgi:hypothetical protein
MLMLMGEFDTGRSALNRCQLSRQTSRAGGCQRAHSFATRRLEKAGQKEEEKEKRKKKGRQIVDKYLVTHSIASDSGFDGPCLVAFLRCAIHFCSIPEPIF